MTNIAIIAIYASREPGPWFDEPKRGGHWRRQTAGWIKSDVVDPFGNSGASISVVRVSMVFGGYCFLARAKSVGASMACATVQAPTVF